MSDRSVAGGDRLSDYFGRLAKHWPPVVAGLLLGVVAALVFLQLAPGEYRADTSVLVTNPTDGTSPTVDRSPKINLDTEAQLLTATDTATAAAQRLGMSPDKARALASHVSVSVPPNSEVLDISFTAASATDAQRGSQAFADAYLDQRRAAVQAALDAADKALQGRIDAVNAQLQGVLGAAASMPLNSPQRAQSNVEVAALNTQLATLGNQQNDVRATIVSPGRIIAPPVLPTASSKPTRSVVLTAGIALGLLAGVGAAAMRYRSDDRIRTAEHLSRSTGLPVAAALSTRLPIGEVALVPPSTADGRGYARLRNLVTTGLRQTDRPVVLVAGIRHGGGPVAANLAAALARTGEDVFLVCADVFSRTSAAFLPNPAGPGLAEVLAGQVDVEDAAQRVDGVPNLSVLGVGRDPDRADALLQTRSWRKLVDHLLGMTTYVVIDAPSTTDSPDAQSLAHVAGAAILVVELGQTTSRQALDACGQFESMGTPVLATVAARYRNTRGHHRILDAPKRQGTSPVGSVPAADDDLGDGFSPPAAAPTDSIRATVSSNGGVRSREAGVRSREAGVRSREALSPDSRDVAPR